ncbi:MAG: molecular chaperone GrpE [Alphaproteobacteria bacterium]|jgi:molecular chaperone GrpE
MTSENETNDNAAQDAPLDQVNQEEVQNQWPTDIEALHTLLNEFEQERTTLTDKLDKVMRAYAEAENKSKRAEKDKIDAIKFGPIKFARDILEVADNFERALKAFPETDKQDLNEMFEGLALTEKSLHQVLGRFNVTPIETENASFDPNLHEAVTQIPHPEKQSGEIIDVIRKGYRMGERLLRPAQVVTVV